MRFIHVADVHLGAWRDPLLSALPTAAFSKMVDEAVKREVDFVVIAGDLFHTAIPAVHHLKDAVKLLRKLKNHAIPVYVIPGSHDHSPTGRSMIEVLDEAGLLKNLWKPTTHEGRLHLHVEKDQKMGAILTGVLGKHGMLDQTYYATIDTDYLAKQVGDAYSIFLFHTSIRELISPELGNLPSTPLSILPKGFDYYAGGHVHIVSDVSLEGYPLVAYPGPLFPANFGELEKLGQGQLIVVEDGKIIRVPLQTKKVVCASVRVDGLQQDQYRELLREKTANLDVEGAVVLLRVSGSLPEDDGYEGLREITEEIMRRGAYAVLKNTRELLTQRWEEELFAQPQSRLTQEALIDEHIGQITSPLPQEKELITSLLRILADEKHEGESTATYEERIQREAAHVLGIDEQR